MTADLNVEEGSQVYGNAGYTDYELENFYRECEGIEVEKADLKNNITIDNDSFSYCYYVEICPDCGFPLPYICPGWHTSLSYQIFIGEFLIDFAIYFVFCFIIIFVINRFVWEIKRLFKNIDCRWLCPHSQL